MPLVAFAMMFEKCGQRFFRVGFAGEILAFQLGLILVPASLFLFQVALDGFFFLGLHMVGLHH